ncbi:FkbM family methyltransferase [Yersinia frederiksenii]|uniref:FkbM family methyltransferase n=1 Tax=Yersinia frederiksenii TaxID=29484 RepID=UPI0005E52F8D|nr:FkbM family methyltransferase [Yersinia frederiksenii]CNF03553.1 methyltransferase%2C FkbM family [Yersinia frederiksenii]
MTFIKYAQNFEDLYLWRALKNIKNGFYIDVGANSPTVDSVTKYFYDIGWHGINIEPLTKNFKALERERVNDINLQLAVGNENTEIKFYDTSIQGEYYSGLASASFEVAQMHSMSGICNEEINVKMTTLEDICDKYILDNQDIHFLKIDVEGFEKAVIEGANFKKYRPWIIVIEATKPGTQELHYEHWEYLILADGYEFAFFDGINRYYYASERKEIFSDVFNLPITVFDDYISYKEIDLKSQVDTLKNKLNFLEVENNKLNKNLNNLSAELSLVYKSNSWRITKPLRWLCEKVKKKNYSLNLKSNLKLHIVRGCYFVFGFLNKNPKLKRNVIRLLDLLKIKEKTKKVFIGIRRISDADRQKKNLSGHFRGGILPPHAKNILLILEENIKNKDKEV